jgi:Carboxypeptidase regulatory-like domain/TonB dependent receptor
MSGNQNHPLRRRSGLLWVTLLCLALVQLTSQLAFGQIDQGSITGIIQDSSGAVVPNATVTLTSTDTGLTIQTHSDGSGGYTFSPVRIGNYQVSATATGFSTTTQQNLKVDVQQHAVVNLQLKPGSATETVEVTSSVPLMQTEDASVGQVVSSKSVNDLPLNGRNFTFLAQLAAGVNTPQADTRGNAASGAFSANGGRPAENNYMLDGIDNNSDTVDFLNGTNYVVLPPVDAIQEFKVQTSDFSAEFGRSGSAVLNATIKSGTNSFHGAAWEFFRNDALDAKDYFEQDVQKGELRQNQYGGAIGGPVIKNKIFIFGDYEGLRRLQGTILTGSVPTLLEKNSGFTDLSDLITAQASSPARPDALGRLVPVGTILDPETTRAVTAGVVDPVSGRPATSTGFVRDPFGTCAPATAAFTLAACGLNQFNTPTLAARLDPNAIKLLNLYPNPTNGGFSSNFANSPKLSETRKSFDTRLDVNFSPKNQVFYRFSFVDDPQMIPGLFGGLADGGAFQQGIQTALAQQSALAFTHVFSPTAVNVARAGLNYLHTTRNGPLGNDLSDLPSQFGILGIPQSRENGGLPTFGINGLSNLGAAAFLPSDEVSSTIQFTDDFTKIYGKHSFKMGFEYQRVKFSTLQPGWSRGEFDFGGNYTDIPNVGGGNTGRAQFLLTPGDTTVAGGIDNVGGPNTVRASNIAETDDGRNYVGGYFQDDWKVTPKLTVNLGVRWDYFGLVFEHHGRQANFDPIDGAARYLIPSGTSASDLSTGPTGFTTLLAQDGINLVIGNKFGGGLGNAQKDNFAPRVGFAYQVSPKLVARGGFGIFYNAFDNRGYGPNIGENYPFVFNFGYFNPNDATPIGAGTPYAGCPTAPTNTATLEAGLSCISFSPLSVNAQGLGLQGIQFNYSTPYSMSGNFTMQYQLTPTLSVQAGYVTTLGRHLETGPGDNNVTQLLPANANADLFKPFLDFGRGASFHTTNANSNYNSLQTKIEKQFAGGLNFLVTYTWAKALSDAGDLLNGGNQNVGYRAPDVPGFGIGKDYGLANFDIRNVVHISGGYELPFGKNKRFMGSSGRVSNALLGGWSVNWVTTLQGGQPITLGCPTNTGAGTNCYDLEVPGQSQDLGLHIDSNDRLSWYGNPKAFAQPCALGGAPGALVPIPNQPVGCVPLNGFAALGGGLVSTRSPGFHRLDFSLFKDFQLTERFRLQFRSEFFNILNHPNFNAPNFSGNGVVGVSGSGDFTNTNFGEIGSTRDAPYDPRQIQFALKLYF